MSDVLSTGNTHNDDVDTGKMSANLDNIKDLPIGTEVDTDLICVIIKIPKNTAHLTMISKMFDSSGNLVELKSDMTKDMIDDARNDFIDYVGDDDYDAVFTLTEEGKRLADSLSNRF